MNKTALRFFSLGILFAAVLIVGASYFIDDGQKVSVKKAEAFLENKGYITLKKEQYEELKKKSENKNTPVEEHSAKVEKLDKPEEKPPATNFQLTITDGMSSETIANTLESEQIIDESQAFQRYLDEYGYSKKIQIGVFELTKGMTFKEISKTITKNK